MSGFKDQKQEKVPVAARRRADGRLQAAAGVASARRSTSSPARRSIDTTRAGTADNISERGQGIAADDLAQHLRHRAHSARLQRRRDERRPTTASVVVAGRNNRYNNLQIDGAVNNDVFGLSSSAGTPGGADRARSRSASTRSRRFSSSSRRTTCARADSPAAASTRSPRAAPTRSTAPAYYFGRNQDWVGKGADRTRKIVDASSDKQGGGSLGGPIVKNKAFFFGNADYGRKDTPVRLLGRRRAGRQSGSQRCVDAVRQRPARRSTATIPADPSGEFARRHDNDKYFFRGDFNVATRHQLTVRHNYIDALNDISGDRRHAAICTPDAFYSLRQHDELDGRAVEQHVRHGRQRAALHLHSACATRAAARSTSRRSRRSRVDARDRHQRDRRHRELLGSATRSIRTSSS